MNLEQLAESLATAEREKDESQWPRAGLAVLKKAAVWANSVPTEFGGAGATSVQRLATYESIARGNLSLALIVTQHDAACELLGDCDNKELARRLLPRCAAGDVLLTVGISQLTTSRQSEGPSMRARRDADSFAMTGVMPWVTSGEHADFVVTGAVLDDQRQILACVDMGAPGMHVHKPFDLMALNSSWTCRVECKDVHVSPAQLMRGPIENVLARRAPVKGLTVSSVGLGVAGALIDACRDRADTLSTVAARIDGTIMRRYASLRKRLFEAAEKAGDPEVETPTTTIRAEVNDLVGRLACTLMILSKGSGYVTGHPAERLVREAMFLYVWSATDDVRAATFSSIWNTHE